MTTVLVFALFGLGLLLGVAVVGLFEIRRRRSLREYRRRLRDRA